MSDDVSPNPGRLVHPARTAVILVVVAALLLLGLLLLERSGPSPVQHLRSISSGQPAAASATGSAGQSPTLARTNAPQTRLANATVSGGGASQIASGTGFNGQGVCTQFLAGTATTISTVTYDTKNGTVTKIPTPGSFWYFVKVQVTTPGTQSFTITQATDYAPTSGTPYFLLGGGSTAFDSSCNDLSGTATGGGASTTVTFTATTAGTYEVGVKFMTHAPIGSSPASDTSGFSYNYTFATTGASGSTQGLMLTHV
jgi:hypothetical protein